MDKTGIIILAAGASTRLGSPKQLLELSGKTLIENVVLTANATEFHPVVVLGSDADKIRNVITDLPVEIVINENWKSGMASSIKVGLDRVLEIHSDLTAVILLLCDQPFITSETLVKLAEARTFSGKPIVASAYEGTLGTPALFSRELFEELRNLGGSKGAKPLIERYRANGVESIPAPEAAFDIDSLKDFKRLNLPEDREQP